MDQKEENLLKKCTVEVFVSDDCMVGYVKLTKEDEACLPAAKEDILDALQEQQVIYGLKESAVEKLSQRPIYNLKIEVARGTPAIDGEDGQTTYFVQRDADYHPDYQEEGTIDYKTLEYFQLVKRGDILCEIKQPTAGIAGKNVFGVEMSPRQGREAIPPLGRNTAYGENGRTLIASCDGVVRFPRDVIEINDMLRIKSNVDHLTGNIHFNGDVTIDGDVCEGYSVWSGGNVIIKGVVGATVVEAKGDVLIAQGINGSGKCDLRIGGDLACKYIESASLHVEGKISADYIIDSKIRCNGDIVLRGSKELVMGGEIKLYGDLKAKDLGTERERVTRIEVLGKEVIDDETIARLKQEKQEDEKRVKVCAKKLTQTTQKLNELGSSKDLLDELADLRDRIYQLNEKIDQQGVQIHELENQVSIQYVGKIYCKRKLYHGVKIWFGDTPFLFELDDLEHCCIHWQEGNAVQSVLPRGNE